MLLAVAVSDSTSRHIPLLQFWLISDFFVSSSVRDISRVSRSHTIPLSECMISAAWSLLAHAHARTHRGTVCRRSARRHSLRHTVHIYSFITMNQCLTKDSTFSPPVINHRPGLLCAGRGRDARVLAYCVLQH